MKRYVGDQVMLPSGFASQVGIDVEDGTIVAVTPSLDEASSHGRERLAGIVIPGLPNLHSHTFQRGMAGLAETRGPASDSFWTWRQVMYHFLAELTPEDVEAIAAMAFLEMLERGFTSVAEFHYLHHDRGGVPYANIAEHGEAIARAAHATGIGLTLLPVLYTHGNFGGAEPNPGQRRFLNQFDDFVRLVEGAKSAIARLPDAKLGVAPHSLRAVSPDDLTAASTLVPDGPVHLHIAEQVKEVDDCLAWSGKRPVEWLFANQAVDARWCLIHATHLTDAETDLIAASGAVVGLCPLTESNLGDGIFPGERFVHGGGRFGVGTDSNIEISAPGELKTFEYSQRLLHRRRNVLPSREGESTGELLYQKALAGGAQALGRRIGAISVGSRADWVVLNSSHPDLIAGDGHRWLDSYLFVAGHSLIEHVYAGGVPVVTAGRHHARDEIVPSYVQSIRRLAAK